MKRQMFQKPMDKDKLLRTTWKKNHRKRNPDKKRDKMKPTDILKPVPAQTGSESDARKKAPKGLPSHWGPKVSCDVVFKFVFCTDLTFCLEPAIVTQKVHVR